MRVIAQPRQGLANLNSLSLPESQRINRYAIMTDVDVTRCSTMTRSLTCITIAIITVTIAACASDSRSNGTSARDSVSTVPIDSSHQTGAVFDRAAVLSADERNELAAALRDIEESSTVRIVVVTVDSLGGKSIEKVASDLFTEMKVGRPEVNNGVVIVLAPNQATVRIEVGLGLEWQVSDSIGSVIITEMIKSLRRREFAAGLQTGIARLRPLVTSVPWVTRYHSLLEVDKAASLGRGEIAELKGALTDVHDSSASLNVDGRTIALRTPPHWYGAPDRATNGQSVTVTGRVVSTEPLELQVLGMER